jgi:hypothetical protein
MAILSDAGVKVRLTRPFFFVGLDVINLGFLDFIFKVA